MIVWVILRRIVTCLIFAVFLGNAFIDVDHWVCGEANGQNAAGGGAAIGMVAIVIVLWAWPLSFIGLTLIDVGKRLKWWSFSLFFRYELLVLATVVAIWYGVAWWLALSSCPNQP